MPTASALVHRGGRLVLGVALSTTLLAVPAWARTTRVSVAWDGSQATGGEHGTFGGKLSSDGQVVAFSSDCANLVPGDTNGTYDVFVRDLAAGTTTRVSVGPGGAQADGASSVWAVSADGRFVFMTSSASNLVAGGGNSWGDVFVHDRSTGTTTRVNVAGDGTQANAPVYPGGISADGRFVSFESDATNLVAGDTNGVRDSFVHDRATGLTTRVSVSSAGVAGNGNSVHSSLSADGRFVAFASDATNLVPNDNNGAQDIFVHDRSTGTTERVSVRTSGSEGTAYTIAALISADGRSVFMTSAAVLDPADKNGNYDAYVHDRETGVTSLMSAVANPGAGRGLAYNGVISADGRFVTFDGADYEYAGELPGHISDTNGTWDAFLKDRSTGITRRMSAGIGGHAGDGESSAQAAGISDDGRFVLFSSRASNLVAGDTNGLYDLFLYEQTCGDGVVDEGEECDDGNDASGDGCWGCVVTACGDGVVTAGEECDDGNAVVGDGCRPDCHWDTCGDGLPGLGEECDDGNAVDGDGCDSNCTTTRCGNGIVSAGEECDDFNVLACDGCNPDCTAASFGPFSVKLVNRGDTSQHGVPTTDGVPGDGNMSADGRYVVFYSWLPNLVPGDTNGATDVFLRDRVAGTTTRLSVGPGGVEGNDGTFGSATPDGRFVIMTTWATNLVTPDNGRKPKVLVLDRSTGELEVGDIASDGTLANDYSHGDGLSDDGRYVLIESEATNLVAGDTNGVRDVFVHDRLTGTTTRVSVSSTGIQGNGVSSSPTMSADGRIVAFLSSATNLVPGDTNGEPDVFVHDVQTGITTRVSVGSDGSQADGPSGWGKVSGDGRWVLFENGARLAPNDQDGKYDVYLRDLATGTTTLVSADKVPGVYSRVALMGSISYDGRYVTFYASDGDYAGDVERDNNGKFDAFWKDMATGRVIKMSKPPGGGQSNGNMIAIGYVSADGRYAYMRGDASNLVHGDTNNSEDLFLWEHTCGNGTLDCGESCEDGNDVSGDGCDENCTVTACGNGIVTAGEECDDGNAVVGDGCKPDCHRDNCGDGLPGVGEECDDGNAVEGDGCDSNCTTTRCGNGVVSPGEECDDGNALACDGCNPDCTAGPVGALNTTRGSVGTGGVQGTGGRYGAFWTAMSADGRFIAFSSDFTNLVPGDTNDTIDAFVYDRETGITTRVSVGPGGVQGDAMTFLGSMSSDGRYIGLTSWASSFVAGDTNNRQDVFLLDRTTGTIQRASVASDGAQGNGNSYSAEVSDDGRFVAFDSDATNLIPGDTNGIRDIFVRDVVAGTTTRVSVGPGGRAANGDSYSPSISGDGRMVAFTSQATNLVAGDSNGHPDVFVHDRVTGVTSLVSVASDGTRADSGGGAAQISGDGRFVVFGSGASNLTPGDINGNMDVFVRDLIAGTTERVSALPIDRPGQELATSGAISFDGRFVAFTGVGDNRYLGDTGEADHNGKGDVYLHDRLTGETIRVSGPPGGCQGNDDSSGGHVSPDGRFVGFISRATSLVAGDTNGRMDVFLYERLCGNGVVDGSEACDDGNQANGDGCDANCTPTGCGNGLVTAGELCDDGNAVSGDGCNPDCTFDGCGNGVVEGTELCDDGNQVDGDGCDTNCTPTGCGNGIVTAGEECDDGNTTDGDGCSHDCHGLACPSGWAVSNARLTLKKLDGTANDEEMVLKGRLDVPPGVTFDPARTGVQLLLREDGVGGRTLFELTNQTFVIPPSTFNGCDQSDGWRDANAGRRQKYTNKSKCLGPPACAPGSANGIKTVAFSDKREVGRGIDFAVKTKGSSIVTAGRTTLVATLVLGTEPSDAASGNCAQCAFATATCKVSTTGATIACR